MISDIFTAEAVGLEIAEAAGGTDTDTLDRAYRTINRALRMICRKGSWPFFRREDDTITTVSGTESYNLKERVKLPKFLHIKDPARKLRMIDLRTLRRAYPNNTDTRGVPLYWRLKNYNRSSNSYQVALWPIPDGVYTIYVDADQNPELISDKTDDIRATGLPEEMIETLINIGIALMFEKNGDADYQSKMALAMAMLDDDYYRLGSSQDDDLDSRTYGLESGSADPILPGQYEAP